MSSPVVEAPTREVGANRGRASQISADSDATGRPARAAPNAASVKINVEGAFIVDEEFNGRNGAGEDGVHYEHKDIRLPHHTAVVSHVAVDVSTIPLPLSVCPSFVRTD
jgi:type II pantothenate kinase